VIPTKKRVILTILVIASLLAVVVLIVQSKKEIKCSAIASYDSHGRYVLITPQESVKINEITIWGNKYHENSRYNTIFRMPYKWLPGQRIPLVIETSKGECRVTVTAPEIQPHLNVTVVKIFPDVALLEIDSTGMKPSILFFHKKPVVSIYSGQSIFVNTEFLKKVEYLLADQLQASGITVHISKNLKGSVGVVLGGIMPSEADINTTSIIFFGSAPPYQYFVNNKGGISAEKIQGIEYKSSKLITTSGKQVMSLWAPAPTKPINNVLAHLEDNLPGEYVTTTIGSYPPRKIIVYTFPVDSFSSPEVAVTELLHQILKNNIIQISEKHYIHRQIALELPPGNYTLVATGWGGNIIRNTVSFNLSIPVEEGILEVKRSGANVSVRAAYKQTDTLVVINLNKNTNTSYPFNGSSVLNLRLTSGEKYVMALYSGHSAVAAKVVDIPLYSFGKNNILLKNGAPYTGIIDIFNRGKPKPVKIYMGKLPTGVNRIRVDGFELKPPHTTKIPIGMIVIGIVIITALFFSVRGDKDTDNSIVILFSEQRGEGLERETVDISPDELKEAMLGLSRELGMEYVALSIEEVRQALVRFVPSVVFFPSLQEVKNLLAEFIRAGYLQEQEGYYAPEKWCKDQSIEHLVMCRAAHEKLTVQGVSAKITTKMKVEEVQREVVKDHGKVYVMEKTVKKKARVPDIIGKKGDIIYLVECETGKRGSFDTKIIKKIRKHLLKANSFPENFIFWLVLTSRSYPFYEEISNELRPMIDRLIEQNRLRVFLYKKGQCKLL